MTTPHTTSADIAEAVCQAVAELGDRNSPADWPEAMLVTGDELHLIVTEALAASAPVAPAPQPAPMPYPTDAQIDAVYEQTMSQHLRSQDAPAVRRFGRAMFLCAWNAAAPKADHIEDDLAMAPAPLQQGEYLPLPECDATTVGLGEVWNRHGVRAAIDADRAARGAAQAAPADVRNLLDYAMQIAHERELHVTGHKHDSEGAKDRFIAACERAFGTSAAPAPVAEDAEIRKALHDAATSLETISRIAGKDPYMLEMVDVRVYAAARAKVARDAQAAQPEGDAK